MSTRSTIKPGPLEKRPTSTTQDGILTELQRKIYGQRSERLTPVEINRIFQYPVSNEFNAILHQALVRNSINVDVTILQIIPIAKTKNYLIPIAMCLRYGADANMYVNAPNLGTIHILGYIYIMLVDITKSRFKPISDQIGYTSPDSDVLNAIVIMFLAKGSRPSLPMYDNRAGKIGNTDAENRITSLSVMDWLSDKGYDTIFDKLNMGQATEIQKALDPEASATISILLDSPGLSSRAYTQNDAYFAIAAFSSVVLKQIPIPNTMRQMDYKTLDDSVTYFNSSAFDYLVNKGQIPSYLLMNKIIIGMKTYRARGDIVIVQELERMLLVSISFGTELDQDQMAIISVMGKDIFDSVNRAYEIPYWEKICKAPDNNTEITDNLRELAISLNIDPTTSKSAICENLSNLSRADKDALIQAARDRQQLKMNTEMGRMNEFVGNKVPNLVCRNKNLLSNDILDYNDIDTAYYRDDQGAVWCFTSDKFASTAEEGINPYNGTKLPDSFIRQLKFQIQTLRNLGIDADRGPVGIYSSKVPQTYTSSINKLTSKDSINEKNSEIILDYFNRLANDNSVSTETIRSLTKSQMMSALRTIDYNVDLDQLSTSHALVTTARIIYYVSKTQPTAINTFFDTIRANYFR